MSVTIFGASDDLIEVEGDVHEEFNVDSEEPTYIGCSDGTLLKITYDGNWHIKPIHEGEMEVRIKIPKGEEYTDIAEVSGDIRWIVCGKIR